LIFSEVVFGPIEELVFLGIGDEIGQWIIYEVLQLGHRAILLSRTKVDLLFFRSF